MKDALFADHMCRHVLKMETAQMDSIQWIVKNMACILGIPFSDFDLYLVILYLNERV